MKTIWARLSEMQKDGVVWTVLASLYLLNKNPFWGWNDALGFAADAAAGWSPYTNATSHFLYTNVLHVLFSLFFFLDPALVATTFSVICGLLTIWQMKRIVVVAGGNAWAGRMMMLVWGLSFTFWQQSEGVEVYAFNCLIAAGFLLSAVKDLVADERKNWLAVGVFLGLGLLTHIQWILALPFFGYYLVAKKDMPIVNRLASVLVAGALASVLLILPLVTGKNSLPAVFFDNQFQNDVLGFQWSDLAKGMVKGIGYFVYNFHVFAVLIVWAWWRMLVEKSTLRWPLLLFALPFWGFASKYGVSDNHVFYLLPYMALVLPLGMKMRQLCYRFVLLEWASPLAALILPVTLYATTTWAVRQTEFGRRYDEEKAYKGGVTHICWPGRAWAKDPLTITRHYLQNDPGAFERGKIEWNYPGAVAYLEAIEGK